MAKVGIAVILLVSWVSLSYAAQSLDGGLTDLTNQIVNGLSGEQKHKIAVAEFSNMDGRTTEFGALISEELITRLFRTGKFEVVERQLLKKVIEEHKLNLSGHVDERTAKKLGRILGVDAICAGTITDLTDSVEINARLIVMETGSIFAVASSDIEKDAAIKRLMNKIRIKYNESPDTGTKKVSRSAGGNMVYNGGFTKRYEGWEKQIGDISQGSSKTGIISFPNGKSGKALHIRHEGRGSIQFAQMVDVPSPNLMFSVSFQALSHEGMITGFAGTGVVQLALQYIGEEDNILGRTVLLNYVQNPFADSPLIGVPRKEGDTYKSHYVEIKSNKFYSNYTIDIKKEIEDNLLGIDMDALRKIAIIIWCGATHSQADAELWITDVSLRQK